jgi:hypothetical protein
VIAPRTHTPHHTLAAAVVLILAMLAAACGGGGGGSGDPAAGTDANLDGASGDQLASTGPLPVSVALPLAVAGVPMRLAADSVDPGAVTLSYSEAATETVALDELASGEVDLAVVSSTAALLANAEGTTPLRVVSAITTTGTELANDPPLAFVSADRGFTSLGHLANEVVGVASLDSYLVTAAVTAALEIRGSDVQIEFTEMAPRDQIDAVVAGDLVVALLDEPYATEALLVGLVGLDTLGKQLCDDTCPSTVLVARADWADEHANVSDQVRAGVDAALGRIANDPSVVAATLGELGFGPEVTEKIRLAPWQGNVDRAGLAAVAGALVDRGVLSGSADQAARSLLG